ncbi:unnamed protein product, partial [Laminaria digitata]
EDAEALAAEHGEPSIILHTDRRRMVDTSSPFSGGGFPYNSLVHDANLPVGCHMESVPRAIRANSTYYATAVLKAISEPVGEPVSEPQGNFHHRSSGGSAPSPGQHRHDCNSGCAVSGNGSGSAGGRSGSDGITVLRDNSGKHSVPLQQTGPARAPATAEREEQQLMASIARLDALLKSDRAPPTDGKPQPSRRKNKPAASTASARTGDSVQTETSQGRARERKPARSGGITQTRVRKGGGSDTKSKICGSSRAAPAVPADRSSASSAVESAAVPPTAATPVADTSAAITQPVVFPPLVRRERVCSDETPERRRCLPSANGNDDSKEAAKYTREKNPEDGR